MTENPGEPVPTTPVDPTLPPAEYVDPAPRPGDIPVDPTRDPAPVDRPVDPGPPVDRPGVERPYTQPVEPLPAETAAPDETPPAITDTWAAPIATADVESDSGEFHLTAGGNVLRDTERFPWPRFGA